jgi:hypothetical protein
VPATRKQLRGNNDEYVNPGNTSASANTPKSSQRRHTDAGLRWLPSSEAVRRDPYCVCGATLRSGPQRRGWSSTSLGAVDGDCGLQRHGHPFIAEVGHDAPQTADPPQPAPSAARSPTRTTHHSSSSPDAAHQRAQRSPPSSTPFMNSFTSDPVQT